MPPKGIITKCNHTAAQRQGHTTHANRQKRKAPLANADPNALPPAKKVTKGKTNSENMASERKFKYSDEKSVRINLG